MTEQSTTTAPRGIDPRSPRFGASITVVLLAVAIALATAGAESRSGTTIGERVTDPAFILLVVIDALFAWGAFAGIRRHPYGWIFRTLIRPRLKPPVELEDPRPPTFAQGVGFFVVAVGLVLSLLGVPFALVVSASAAFIAAFLNSVFNYCLGCQMYLLLQRLRPGTS